MFAPEIKLFVPKNICKPSAFRISILAFCFNADCKFISISSCAGLGWIVISIGLPNMKALIERSPQLFKYKKSDPVERGYATQPINFGSLVLSEIELSASEVDVSFVK